MTIDERLDRLTERHEALTQSVELIAQMTQDNARQIGALREAACESVEDRSDSRESYLRLGAGRSIIYEFNT
jgi:hypothetical protein